MEIVLTSELNNKWGNSVEERKSILKKAVRAALATRKDMNNANRWTSVAAKVLMSSEFKVHHYWGDRQVPPRVSNYISAIALLFFFQDHFRGLSQGSCDKSLQGLFREPVPRA